ncbi:ester cyclase [Bacteroides sedimenti]|uniref:Polyketide cyclase n=1 Tax=Bacteroides sedimenti TaxID=2136147 RepID=A0ABN6Z3E1_9BACE
MNIKKLIYLVLAAILSSTTVVGAEAQNVKKSTTPSQNEINRLRAQIKELTANNAVIAKNLVTFDTLDFTVFSHQQWVRLHESHAKDIKVYWPDGHYTLGIERHLADLKSMFVYAPNTKITEHPIRFGSGNRTCVTGVMTGTFTKPMPIGDGKFIQPTGKSFKLPMCTVGIWKDGVMIEEYLFWDNQTYMNQLGLGK